MTHVPLFSLRRLLVPLPWWLLVWFFIPYLLYQAVRLLIWLAPIVRRNWVSFGLLAAGLVLWHRYGLGVVALVLVAVGGGLAVWWWRWPAPFRRVVGLPVLGWWRRVFLYRRHWRETMTACRLTERLDRKVIVPAVLRVRCTTATDEVLVRMPRGQHADEWHRIAGTLAYSFDARQCRIRTAGHGRPAARSGRLAGLWRVVDRVRYRDRPRLLWLVFVRRDPLLAVVVPLPVPAVPDFAALVVGLRDDLQPLRLRLLASHILIVGATRSGKGSVQWSLIRAVAAGIRSGLVRLWGIDPKGGVELSIGRALFSRYEHADPAPMVVMLEDLVSVMRGRQERMQGHVRVHTPTLDEPLYVLLVDEMLALVALLTDGDLRYRARSALALLLTQGAGLGVLVVGATQDPRKEVIELRDFFPTRVALRVTERNYVDLILGDGARARGALADQIPADPGMRGIGYVVLDERPEPVRVRFSYLTDDDVRALASDYPAPPVRPEPVHTGAATTASGSVSADADRPEPRRRTRRQRRSGPLLPDSLANLLDRDTDTDRPRDERDAA